MRLRPPAAGRVLSIQSSVVHGTVGNQSATLPLLLLGLTVDSLNTCSLSNHKAYAGGFAGAALPASQFRELMGGLRANALLERYDYVLTGYVGQPELLAAIADELEAMKAAKPELTVVVDPVLGDDGRLYVAEECVAIYRERMLPLCSVATPNAFELALLTAADGDGEEAEAEVDVVEAATTEEGALVAVRALQARMEQRAGGAAPTVLLTTLDEASRPECVIYGSHPVCGFRKYSLRLVLILKCIPL